MPNKRLQLARRRLCLRGARASVHYPAMPNLCCSPGVPLKRGVRQRS